MTFAEGFRQFNELIEEFKAAGMTEEEATHAAANSGLLEKQKDLFNDNWEEEAIELLRERGIL